MLSASSPSLTSTGLGIDAVGHVAEAHRVAGVAAQGLEALQQRAVGVELVGRLAAGQAEIAGAHDHQRHRGIDAGDLDAVDRVDAAAGRETPSR